MHLSTARYLFYSAWQETGAHYVKNETADGKTSKAVSQRHDDVQSKSRRVAEKVRVFHAQQLPSHDSFARHIHYSLPGVLGILAVRKSSKL